MIGLSKTDQLKKETRSHKICKKCDRKRLIKFFEKPTSLICNDCKRRSKRVNKQSSKRYIIKAKTKELRLQILERDNHQCQKCGVSDQDKVLHLSHVYTKGAHPELRLDPDNVKMLCHKCHIYWWHREVREASEWFSEKFPERAKRLKEKLKNNKE